jgi:hypothetical protein
LIPQKTPSIFPHERYYGSIVQIITLIGDNVGEDVNHCFFTTTTTVSLLFPRFSHGLVVETVLFSCLVEEWGLFILI